MTQEKTAGSPQMKVNRMSRFENTQNIPPRDTNESPQISGRDIIEGAIRDTFSVERPSYPNADGKFDDVNVFKSQDLKQKSKKKPAAETVRVSGEMQYENIKNYARNNSMFGNAEVLRTSNVK